MSRSRRACSPASSRSHTCSSISVTRPSYRKAASAFRSIAVARRWAGLRSKPEQRRQRGIALVQLRREIRMPEPELGPADLVEAHHRELQASQLSIDRGAYLE